MVVNANVVKSEILHAIKCMCSAYSLQTSNVSFVYNPVHSLHLISYMNCEGMRNSSGTENQDQGGLPPS